MTIQIAQRIGRALGVRSGTRIKELDEGLREYVRTVPQARTTPITGSIAASQVTSGTFADPRIAESNVTQHQAALALAASQINSGILGAVRGGTGHGSFTAGDLLYANTISTLARLGIGTAGDLLRVSGGAPAWQAASTLSIAWSQLTSVPSTFTPAVHLTTGTWTPADNSGAGLTLTVDSATYVKHEDLVMAMLRLSFPATADTSLNELSGLPFSCANPNANRQGFMTWANAAVSYVMPVGAGASTVRFYDSTGARMQNSALSGATLAATVLYRT